MPVVTIPGCPPHPQNFLSTVVHFLTFKKLPALDDKGRPLFAYGRLIHENCERRPHFDAGRFAGEFGDEGHRQGWCLYKLGCKGPETYANCPVVGFNDVGEVSWPVGCGHPCSGCTESCSTGMLASGYMCSSGDQAPWSRPRVGSHSTSNPAASSSACARDATSGAPGAG